MSTPSSSGNTLCAEIHKRLSGISFCDATFSLVDVPECLSNLSFNTCPIYKSCTPDANASFSLGDGGTVNVSRCTVSPARARTLTIGFVLLLLAVLGGAYLWLRHQGVLHARIEMLIAKNAAASGLTRVGGQWVPAT